MWERKSCSDAGKRPSVVLLMNTHRRVLLTHASEAPLQQKSGSTTNSPSHPPFPPMARDTPGRSFSKQRARHREALPHISSPHISSPLSKKVKCLMRVCEKNLSFATHKAETLRRNLMEESVRKSDHSYGGKNTNKHPLFSVTRATTTAILLSSHHVDIEQRLSFSALKRNSLTHRIKSQF